MTDIQLILDSISDCCNYQRDKELAQCQQQIAAVCAEVRRARYECEVVAMNQLTKQLHKIKTLIEILKIKVKCHPRDRQPLFDELLAQLEEWEQTLRVERNSQSCR